MVTDDVTPRNTKPTQNITNREDQVTRPENYHGNRMYNQAARAACVLNTQTCFSSFKKQYKVFNRIHRLRGPLIVYTNDINYEKYTHHGFLKTLVKKPTNQTVLDLNWWHQKLVLMTGTYTLQSNRPAFNQIIDPTLFLLQHDTNQHHSSPDLVQYKAAVRTLCFKLHCTRSKLHGAIPRRKRKPKTRKIRERSADNTQIHWGSLQYHIIIIDSWRPSLPGTWLFIKWQFPLPSRYCFRLEKYDWNFLLSLLTYNQSSTLKPRQCKYSILVLPNHLSTDYAIVIWVLVNLVIISSNNLIEGHKCKLTYGTTVIL